MGATSLLYNTLLSPTWTITPGSDTPAAEKYADFAAQALGLNGKSPQLDTSFEQQLQKMLPFALVGARYLEEIQYVDAAGNVWLRQWDDREPSAHHSWLFDGDGEFSGVTQYGWNSPEPQLSPISAEHLLLLTLNRTGKNLRGVGMLRPAYSWWKLKQFMREAIGVGGERWAVPTPKITVNRQDGLEAGYKGAEIDTLVSAAQRVAQEYASRARSYVQDVPFIQLGTFGEGAMDFKGPLDVISYCDQAILTSLVMQFMEIGFTQVGARNVSEVQEHAFRMSASNLLDKIAHTIQAPAGPGRGTIHKLLKLNFGEVEKSDLPVLTHSGIDVDPLISGLAEIVPLVDRGLLSPNEVQARIHEHFRLPPPQGGVIPEE
jgi:hypothetical protein